MDIIYGKNNSTDTTGDHSSKNSRHNSFRPHQYQQCVHLAFVDIHNCRLPMDIRKLI